MVLRRLAAVIVLVVFASLNAIDGLCCPDGCTREETTSRSSTPQSSDGACVLCVGCVHGNLPDALSPGDLLTTAVFRSAPPDPATVSPDPPERPPRL
jgi:hypothetical protein